MPSTALDQFPIFFHRPGAVPRGGEAVMAHHLEAFGEWLRAGAEPRLAIVLLSGPAARARFEATMTAQGAEVISRTCTLAAPLPPELIAHAGTHFNRKLFVLDGLGDPAVVAQLEGRRGMVNKVATWVALVIDSVAALDALAVSATGLMGSAMRRLLLIHPDDPVEARLLSDGARARLRHHAPELAYEIARSPAEAQAAGWPYLALGGYSAQTMAHAGPELLAVDRWGREGGPSSAIWPDVEALGAVAGGIAARLFGAPMPAAVSALFERAEAGDWAAFKLLGARPDAAAARSALDLFEAEVRAENEDLEGCIAALERVAHDRRRCPLARFEACERRLQIHLFLDERTGAQQSREYCEVLAIQMQSLIHHARTVWMRSAQIGVLDPGRARVERQIATAFCKRHGLPIPEHA